MLLLKRASLLLLPAFIPPAFKLKDSSHCVSFPADLFKKKKKVSSVTLPRLQATVRVRQCVMLVGRQHKVRPGQQVARCEFRVCLHALKCAGFWERVSTLGTA